jgi:hypothetical protein
MEDHDEIDGDHKADVVDEAVASKELGLIA